MAMSDTSRSKQAAATQWSLVTESRWAWTDSGVRFSSASVDHGFAMTFAFGEGGNVGKLGDGTKAGPRGSVMPRTDEFWLALIALLAQVAQDTRAARRGFLPTTSA